MPTTATLPPPDTLKLLAHDVRWKLVAELAASDRRVQELVERLQRPQNLISYHLRLLREGHLVSERRSSADGRDVYYSLDLDGLRTRYLAEVQTIHPALACPDPVPLTQPSPAPHRILFLCTHNSARSQLAEGILRATVGNAVEVQSAGNEPGRVHPLAVRAAAELGIDISNQRSKHIDEFAGQPFDVVITVCDRVREICPVFPDDPQQIHWSLRDPAAVAGTEDDQYEAFRETAQELTARVAHLHHVLERHHPEQGAN